MKTMTRNKAFARFNHFFAIR